ncbi:MAG: PilZ domain-containing protein, partial [Erythrobacter sp.]|nr:PilZ domain-containing protein [Erythrobacter sp.]
FSCEQSILPPIGRRAAARLRLAIPARLRTTQRNTGCVLLDLSCTGARIGMEGPLAPGTLLYLEIARLDIFAEVVRRHRGQGGGVNGLLFDQPLSGDEVLMVRHHAETYEQRQHEAFRDQVRRWVRGESHL